MAKKIKIGWLQKYLAGAALIMELFASITADNKITVDEIASIGTQALKNMGVDVIGEIEQ